MGRHSPIGSSVTAQCWFAGPSSVESEPTELTTTYPSDHSQATLLRQEVGDANL
jgi:hypothetical protein